LYCVTDRIGVGPVHQTHTSMSVEVSNFETMPEETKEKSTASQVDTTPFTAHQDDALENDDSSDMLLARLKQNAMLYPNKRALVFLAPSTAGAVSKIVISQERTYEQVESESTLLSISLLVKHKLKKGDRYVKMRTRTFCSTFGIGSILRLDFLVFNHQVSFWYIRHPSILPLRSWPV
jgi:hypothetical protein